MAWSSECVYSWASPSITGLLSPANTEDKAPAIISKDSQTALSLVEAESDYASIQESDLFSKPQR